MFANIASKHDGQDDGDGIGGNVREARQIKGHLPQRVGKYHCKFHQFGMLPVNIFYSVHELPKKLKMRVLIHLGLPSSSLPGRILSILFSVVDGAFQAFSFPSSRSS